MNPKKALQRRLETLEAHLRAEHPSLLPVIPTFRNFDRILYRMGLLSPAESLASRIPWWPMISILGLFSAGKSSFINSYIGADIQASGNQAVDDKFTVLCFGPDRRYDALPGTALNSDPRFPFYRMSDEIEKVAAGEGKRIDSYLQLKTCSSPRVKGKIIIDSPGFDADDQRRSTLRVTDHIIDLADLVLIFFDARRPEPGSMQDTLQHLVARTVQRSDSRKFLYVLNQIDTSAREDNPEAVVGAWQRSIAQAGLVSGKFYGIYNKDVAPPIEDPVKRARYEAKCNEDLAEIHARMTEVEFGRGYRIVGILDALAKELEGEYVPYLQRLVAKWRRKVLIGDGAVLALLIAGTGALAYTIGGEGVYQFGSWLLAERPEWFGQMPVRLAGFCGSIVALLLAAHYALRSTIAHQMASFLPERMGQMDLNVRLAFYKNTRFFQPLFRRNPVGWGGGTKKRIYVIREMIARHVQTWNDMYTDPAGNKLGEAVAVPVADSRFQAQAAYRYSPAGYRQAAAASEPGAGALNPVAGDPVSTGQPMAGLLGGLNFGSLVEKVKALASTR